MQIEVGLDLDTLARLMPTWFSGHCYMCRKCKKKSEIGGIVIPEKSEEDTYWMVVVRRGPNIGKKWKGTRRERKMLERPKWLGDEGIQIGDFVCVPHYAYGQWRVPHTDDFYFIEESVPVMWQKGNLDADV